MPEPDLKPVYRRILQIARQIPPGRVATYGQIAWIEGHCTPRMVGYALGGLEDGTDVPWQRVINAQGGISPRPGAERQHELLEGEGVQFDEMGKIDFDQYGWDGPEPEWLETHGFMPGPPFHFTRR